MISHSIRDQFNGNSFERLGNMIALANAIDGVHYLDGTTIQIGDFTIGGGSAWYDGSYAKEKYKYGDSDIRALWRASMNDANLIYDPRNTLYGILNIFEHAKQENAKLVNLYDKCDLVVTLSPIGIISWVNMKPRLLHSIALMVEVLKGMKPNAHWLLVIRTICFIMSIQVAMLCNPLGYPYNDLDITRRKFKTIELGAPPPSYGDIFK